MAKLDDQEFVEAAQVECTSSKTHGIIEKRAQIASEAAHHVTLAEAIRAYPTAIFWSLMVSMCVVMEGK